MLYPQPVIPLEFPVKLGLHLHNVPHLRYVIIYTPSVFFYNFRYEMVHGKLSARMDYTEVMSKSAGFGIRSISSVQVGYSAYLIGSAERVSCIRRKATEA